MPTRNFRITGGNTANSELRMLGGGRGDTDARERYVINWEVAPLVNVTSIESIELKTQPNNVLFSSIEPLDAPANKHWRGVIKPGVSPRDYMYSIFWNTDPPALQPYEHDPKIAIRPPGGEAHILLLEKVFFIFLGMYSIYRIFSSKKKYTK